VFLRVDYYSFLRGVSFIEEEAVIEKILRHSKLWKDDTARPPPTSQIVESTVSEPVYDYSFSEPA
jgi:hypothetical protein